MQEAEFACYPQLEPNSKSMMKTKLTLFVTVLAAALFMGGCATTEPAFVSDGLVAYYPFNGNANDESGNGHDGTVNGAAPTTDRHGKQNQAYDFSGNPKSSIRSGKSVNATLKTLTLSAWVYLNKQSQNQPADVICWPGASHLLIPPMDGDKPTFGVRPDLESWKNLQYPDGLPSNKWFMYTGIYDGKELALYIDGKKVATTDYSAGILDGEEGPIWIGRNFEPFLPTIKGKVDDVRIYNRALSAAEVKALYDLEKPKTK